MDQHTLRIGKYLQGGTVTIRKGRAVIPVKVRFRDKVSGIVRDQSDSGETLFVEPTATAGAGDELHRLLQEEKQEMFRILQELTDKIRGKLDEITRTLKILSIVDLTNAKACFSKDFDMSEPILNRDGKIDLKEARHPLLMFERGWGRRPVGMPQKEDTRLKTQDDRDGETRGQGDAGKFPPSPHPRVVFRGPYRCASGRRF